MGKVDIVNIELRHLTPDDGIDVYDMCQDIPKDESGFSNERNGKTFDEFRIGLLRANDIASGVGLDEGMVPATTYWLYVDGVPVGMGKLHHYLSDERKKRGGHIAYAVRSSCRGRGYATQLLKLMIEKAKEMKIDKLLLTIQNNNIPSIKVATANNGVIEKVDDDYHFIWIDVSNTG